MKTLFALAAAAVALSLPGLASAQSITDVGRRDAGPPPEAQMHRRDRSHDRHMGREQRRDRGAHYRIEDGRMKISFRCPDGEPAQDCADLLLQVLDRLQANGSSDEGGYRDYDRRQAYRDR
ncbi:hypothetical protein [Rhizobium halophilum]|uniref:hypothetical protein n=1 Tax=Rhizobium halophilum TaxID=2846852 RepID=UPI001EFE1538|nr:hypothetical protein [Rhizobium halophilum]MCF6369097.1 hypothetical protein [Rhizobium halophilum]